MTKREIMIRAWKIYKTLEGDRIAKLSIALRLAWAEAKRAAKKVFEGFAKIAKFVNADRDCEFVTFKSWSKNGKKRIYLNDYKRRTIGYIDQNNDNELVIYDRQGSTAEEIDYAASHFTAAYAI